MAEEGKRFFYRGLPMLCQVCQIPDGVHRAGRPDHDLRSATASSAESASTPAPTAASGSSSGSRRSTCRPGCRCTRSTRATAAGRPFPRCWTGTACDDGDNGEYLTSPDKASWDKWHADASPVATGGRCVMAVKALYDYDFPSKDRAGDLRRRPAGQRAVGRTTCCSARRVLPGAGRDDLGGLPGRGDRPVGGRGPGLRPGSGVRMAARRRRTGSADGASLAEPASGTSH